MAPLPSLRPHSAGGICNAICHLYGAHFPSRQCGSMLQVSRYTVPPCTVVVLRGISTAHPPRKCGSFLKQFHCPLHTGNAAVYCRSMIAQCPSVWRCVVGVQLPRTNKQCRSVRQDLEGQVPVGSALLCCTSSTAHSPHAVRLHCRNARVGGRCSSFITTPHCLGAVRSGTLATQCRTT